MLHNTMESWADTSRQTMRALPTEPLEILLYSLGELEQTVRPDDETLSLVRVRNTLNEGIAFLRAAADRVSPREP